MRKSLIVGIVLAVSFFGVLAAMLMPIWDGETFFKYADDTFNSLSKGSVYFIPEIVKEAEKFNGELMSVEIKAESEETANKIVTLYSEAGADVKYSDGIIAINGDLGAILAKALEDADLGYKNKLESKEILYYWWVSLKDIAKHYKKTGEFDKALFIEEEVITKAIEPAYNYYGIEAKSVSEEPLFVTALLVFYIVYTIWWGFAIFFLFDGLGLRMEGAKEKKEV